MIGNEAREKEEVQVSIYDHIRCRIINACREEC